MKVHDIKSGEDITIPDEFAVSNEVWPTEALGQVSLSSGDAAAVIGSGNAPNILPLIEGLEVVTFMDIAPGHGKVFDTKLNAVRSGLGLHAALGSDFAGALASEAGLFDLLRPNRGLHFTVSEEHRDLFTGLDPNLNVIDRPLNVLDDSKAPTVNSEAQRLAWLHLSNVVPYCVERGAKDVERKVFAFIDDLPGIDDDTVVTYSKRADVQVGDLIIRRLLVSASRLDDIVFSDFLNRDSINMLHDGTVFTKAIA